MQKKSGDIISCGTGWGKNNVPNPRRNATLLREVPCPSTGEYTGTFFVAEYHDTGEKFLTHAD
jgi:hypothetical protein